MCIISKKKIQCKYIIIKNANKWLYKISEQNLFCVRSVIEN